MNDMTATDAGTTDASPMTPISDLAGVFISEARKTGDTDKLAISFIDAVETAMSERGWDADTAARRMISSIEAGSQRDMTDPASFLAKPLREINVSAKRIDAEADGAKVKNTISDIDAAIQSHGGRLADGIHAGLEKLELLN